MTYKRTRLDLSWMTVGVLLVGLASSMGIDEAMARDASRSSTTAAELLESSGCTGGLVVHLGCGDGTLTAALHGGKSYLVHGLDVDPANVERARQTIRSLGIHGRVSVDTFDGKSLPYTDNLVNLLVTEDLGEISTDEVMRVLAPGGTACVMGDGLATSTFIKPWPAEIDQWTHHLHDAGGNAVANDSVVGPPRHLQWTAGPLWARSHGWTPSVSAMVSANGRLFYLCDETLTGVDATVPNKWFLTARDGFSGVLLWKRPVPRWGSTALSGTPETGAGVTTGRFTMPPHVGKRLVAVDETVYVTLGAGAPVTALDAATGQPRRVYEETADADEILHCDGRLIVSINPSRTTPDAPPAKHVVALEAQSGRLLWRNGPFVGIRASKGQDPFGRLELAAGDDKVFALTTTTIECLDADTGQRRWKIDRPNLPDNAVRQLGFAGMYEYLLTVLVYHDGVVLLAQPEPNTHHTYHTMPGTLHAFDADSGRPMWQHSYGGWGHCTPPGVFVIGDVVWTHVDAKTEFGSVWGKGFRALDSSTVEYRIQALDLRTGRLVKELATKDIFNVGHHHRCYRNKITERFLMSSRRGVEFVDLATGEHQQHHWVRSGCRLGNLPCNGLLYVSPHPCGCYLNAKLTGFNALAAERHDGQATSTSAEHRLEKGPAHGRNTPGVSTIAHDPHDWPTYRHDGNRSGSTDATVGAELAPLWTANIGGRLSGLVVAENKVFVADVDAHTMHALDAGEGTPAWQYTAGARVDSPPTVRDGMAIFGSADGCVQCLRATDGALAWRFRAAPETRRVTAFNQLESPWPVPGSVLMHEGKCWFAAGRMSYLDGGVYLFALDPATGEVEHQETIFSADPETGKMSPETDGHAMSGLINDIPATDGSSVFLRQRNVSASEGPARRHLFTTAGYLDSSWFNRTSWSVNGARTSGIMVMTQDVAHGVEIYPNSGRESVFKPAGQGYRLICYSLKESAVTPARRRPKGRSSRKVIWEQRVPIRITAMVRAADKLLVAGSPDVVDPADPHGAWEGRKGGVLAVFNAADGKQLARYQLDAPPTWDGMAVTSGRVFIATTDGHVVAFGG